MICHVWALYDLIILYAHIKKHVLCDSIKYYCIRFKCRSYYIILCRIEGEIKLSYDSM